VEVTTVRNGIVSSTFVDIMGMINYIFPQTHNGTGQETQINAISLKQKCGPQQRQKYHM